MEGEDEVKDIWKNSNVPTILLSVILSLSLWTTVQLNSGKVRQETISNVPVRLLEESTLKTNTGFSVIEGADATIRVDYEAIGSSVAELKKHNMEDVYAEASVGAITEPGRTKVRYTLRYPDNLNISVRSTTPRLIEVWVDEVISREIRIDSDIEGTPADGYLYDSLSPDRETITVQGPAEVVNQISYARATLTAEGATGSLTDLASITFLDKEGNILDAEENHLEVTSGDVNLSLSVLKEGIVPLRVDLTEAPGISAGMAAIDINPQSVKVRGDPLLVDRLSEEGITIGAVDLNRMSEGGTQTMSLRLPNGVSLSAGEPSAAEVTVAVNGVSSRIVEISDIDIDIAAEGWEATLVSGVIPVTVRGPAQLIENFDEGRLRIHATVNTTVMTPGLTQANIEVTLQGSGTDGIAVIEAPETVSVMLRQSTTITAPPDDGAPPEIDTGDIGNAENPTPSTPPDGEPAMHEPEASEPEPEETEGADAA